MSATNTANATSQTNRAYDRTSYILVVDDDNTLLKFFKIHLNKFFSKVIVVKNAKEALDTLKEKQIDLVITDINMPKMDGLTLLKRVHKHSVSIPVLLISGALLDEDQLEEIEREADGYLKKPFTVDQLHEFINLGMELREKMQRLVEKLTIKQKKQFRDIINGNIDFGHFFRKESTAIEVREIVFEISQNLASIRSLNS